MRIRELVLIVLHYISRLSIVESIPDGLEYGNGTIRFNSTYEAWSQLIKFAEKKIDIIAFYWTLRSEDVSTKNFESAWKGEEIFRKLLDAGNNLIKYKQSFQDFHMTSLHML